LLKNPKANQKILRWATQLAEYEFDVKHRSGRANANADALSRLAESEGEGANDVAFDVPTYEGHSKEKVIVHRGLNGEKVFTRRLAPDEEGRKEDVAVIAVIEDREGAEQAFTTMSFDEEGYRQKMRESQEHDKELAVIRALLRDEVPTKKKNEPIYIKAVKQLKVMELVDGLLVRTSVRHDKALGQFVRPLAYQVVIPKERVQEFLGMYHEDVMASHQGANAMINAMKSKVYWHGWAKAVRDYVAGCVTCQSQKPPQPKRQGLLHPFDLSATVPMEFVAVDHYGPLPETPDGMQYILVIICVLCRWAEAIPV
jgi:hypothetical protein